MWVLAEHVPQSPNLGWFLGLGIAFALVVVVVALVAAVLTQASRIEDRAQEALKATEGAHEEAEPLSPQAGSTSGSAEELLETTRRLGTRLTGGAP